MLCELYVYDLGSFTAAQFREMLYLHRSPPQLLHRVKAIFWLCYMRIEHALPTAEILRVMPADDDVDSLFKAASGKRKGDGSGPWEYGSGIVWSEFRMPTEYQR